MLSSSPAAISWLSLAVTLTTSIGGAGAAPHSEHPRVHLRPHRVSAGPLKADVKPAPQVLARRNDHPLLASSPRIQPSSDATHKIHPALAQADKNKLTVPRHVVLEARRSKSSMYYDPDSDSGTSGYGSQFDSTGAASSPYGDASSGYSSSPYGSASSGYGSTSSSYDPSSSTGYGSTSQGYGAAANSLYAGQQQQQAGSPYAGQSYSGAPSSGQLSSYGYGAQQQQAPSAYGSQQAASAYTGQQVSSPYSNQAASSSYSDQQAAAGYSKAATAQNYNSPQQFSSGYSQQQQQQPSYNAAPSYGQTDAYSGGAPSQQQPEAGAAPAQSGGEQSYPSTDAPPTAYQPKSSKRKSGHFAASGDDDDADVGNDDSDAPTTSKSPKKKGKKKHTQEARDLPADDSKSNLPASSPSVSGPSDASTLDASSASSWPSAPDAQNAPPSNLPTPSARRPPVRPKKKVSSVQNAVATARPSLDGSSDSYDDESARKSVEELANADCDALQTIYNEMGGAGWNRADGWIAGGNCCLAFGVTCNESRVVALDLGFNNLAGNLSRAIFDLDMLERINMTNNAISGTLPNSWGSVTSLDTLLLSNNQLDGDLPQTLIDAGELHRVDLSNNALTGKLAFSSASSLEELVADHNEFSSFDIAGTPSLTKIVIDDNPISGVLPKGENLPLLATWSSARCNLTGPSFDMMKLSRMVHLCDQVRSCPLTRRSNVQRNSLTGPFPDATAAPNLQYFATNGNQFAGMFPNGKAPRYLTTCYVDAVPTAACPSQSVMNDPNSLAAKCNLACRGGGPIPSTNATDGVAAVPNGWAADHVGLATSSMPSSATRRSSAMLYAAISLGLSILYVL